MEQADLKKIIQTDPGNEEDGYQSSLRPQTLREYIGQNTAKESLKISIEAASLRGDILEHILLSGPPGLGKTTLANIIAKELGRNIYTTSGPAIQRAGDLASIITNLEEGDVLFIDEIHRLNKAVEEILYSAMEDFALDLVLGKGAGAKTVRLDLPGFTLLGATTRPGLLSAPLRDRFGMAFRLNYYEQEEIENIVNRSAEILAIEIDPPGIKTIAQRSRRTPRVANRLLKRVRDFVQVKKDGFINESSAREALEHLMVDAYGLDEGDRRIIEAILTKFQGGPVGIQAIAAACMEDEETIADVYEPYLMQIGFLQRTPKGRMVTEKGRAHINGQTKLI